MSRFISPRWALPLLAFGALAVAGCDDDDPVGPDEGTLTVTVTAAGAPADPDGFTVLVDGEAFGAVVPAAGGTRTGSLETGTYEVELDGVAANCTVAAENPRDVTITEDQTTTTTFAVTCAAATGTIDVTTTTTGTNVDADGFEFSVAGGTPVTIGANETVSFADVAPGDVDVLLSGIQGNCAVTGDNPLTVTVTGGATAPAAFTVTCVADAGSASVETVTTGTNLDPDGYTLTVDAGAPMNIGVNETITVPTLSVGDHDFVLGGVAANCTVTTDQTVTITDQQITDVTYTVTCT